MSDITSDEDNDYEQATYDMGAVTINHVDMKAKEVFAGVKFQGKDGSCNTIEGKLGTGAMVTCMPAALLQQISVTRDARKPCQATLRGVTGAEMITRGELITTVTCNSHTQQTHIIITELGCELILGIDFCSSFKLIEIADTCIQRSINVDAVHSTLESEADYKALQKKWRKHLPLGKKTGEPLEDLKEIFQDVFDVSLTGGSI